MFLRLILFTQAIQSSFSANIQDESLKDTDNSWNYLGVTGYAGQITMNALTGSSLFYWLFESLDSNITTDSRPLIIWIDGGPGCSGSFAMVWEGISPILVRNNPQPMRNNNNYTWATSYHIISVDFPYGTGFSFANSENDQKNSTIEATLYLYRFLIKLEKKYPVWFNRDIYIFGYSYGGHWIPGLGWNIIQQNSKSSNPRINLKGIGIGGAWVNPLIQSQNYANYATASSLINENESKIIKYYQDLIKTQVSSGQYSQATSSFSNILETIKGFTNGIDPYNVRGFNEYNEVNFDNWITSQSTRSMLHVGSTPWVDCNSTVYEFYSTDLMNSTAPYLSDILSSGLKVLLFGGQDDMMVNSVGILNMIGSMSWSGVSEFLNAQKVLWKIEGQVAGYFQSNNNLTFALVNNAGHMTQFNQPVACKNMVERFINGTGWN
jgi:carboxypeptidase C (cathepsin A)